MLGKKKILFLLGLLLVAFLLSGCKGDEFTKEYIIKRTAVQGEGEIEVNLKSSKKAEVRAVAKENWEFVQWKGSLTGNHNPQTIVLEEGIDLIAEFKYVGPDIIGKGTAENPFSIYTLEGLEKIGTKDYSLDAYYELGQDIDASLTRDKDYNNGQGWEPIGEYLGQGEYGEKFTGLFNGNGYQIRGLYINSKTLGTGFFAGLSENAVVENLGIADIEVKGDNAVGGLAGDFRGLIKNCYIEGDIRGDKYVGGLVGQNVYGRIKDSHAIINITGNIYVGGLIGANYKNTKITNCYVTGNIKGARYIGGLAGWYENGKIIGSYAEGKVSGESRLGGLVGFNKNAIIENCHALTDVRGNEILGGLVGWNENKTIKSSYVIGSIVGEGIVVGGLVGWNKNGAIERSYVEGKVVGNESVGGLVGYNYLDAKIRNSYANANIEGIQLVGGLVGGNIYGIIENSYAKGKVKGSENIGGLVGYNEGGIIKKSYVSGNIKGKKYVGGLVGDDYDGKINYSYWNKEISRQILSAGGEGKTTEELKEQAIFEGWDFKNVWAIDEGESYPYLQWEE